MALETENNKMRAELANLEIKYRKGSPTQVDKIFPPEKNENKEIFEGAPERLSDGIFTLLKTKKFI